MIFERSLSRLLVLGLALLLLPGASAGPDVKLDPEERAWLDAHGPIRYAPDPGYPPFESVDDQGVATGINVDLLNRMSRNLGFDFEVVVYGNWSLVLEAMQAGEVDLLGSLAKTDDRAVYMDFVGPYMSVGEVFYVREDNPARTVKDLVGQQIGVIPSYAASQWLAAEHPEYTTVAVNDTQDGLHKLSVGEIDAFFENIPVAADIIRREALSNVRILGEPLYFSEANWGVRKDDPVFRSIIEKGMASISPGEQTKVFEYWSGYDLGVTTPDPGISPWIRNTLVTLGVVTVVVVGAWSLSLRRTVNRRTQALARSRQEVMALNSGLEHRVKERTHALEEANQALETFGYTVSHDLKTPLTAIRSYNTVLERQFGKELGEEGRAVLARSDQAAERMGTLIDDVLRLSRTAQAELDRQRIDASQVARDALQALADAEPQRKVATTVQPDVTVDADPTLFGIVMSNLLQNAWKYTQDAEAPHIEFGRQTIDGRTVCFVRDNGMGFDASLDVFRPFGRAPEAASFEGTGIGLATVQRAVQRHGGRVWAESVPGEGSTFYVDLGDA